MIRAYYVLIKNGILNSINLPELLELSKVCKLDIDVKVDLLWLFWSDTDCL